MKVTLISHTPDPERTVAAAARLCYSPSGIDDIFEGLTPEKTEKFVEMLGEIGHESPIEHASFTFGIEGVSRALLAQITRHRIASFSVQSQRYVAENSFEFVIPPEIAADSDAAAEFSLAMEQSQQHYEKIAQILQQKHYQAMIQQGIEPKKAQRDSTKKAIEDARFVLPNACDTKMIITLNARSLRNFFSLRCCNRAQWEIRAVADEMLRLVKTVAPNLFKYAGPPCVRGGCPEGKMSCGKAAEIRRRHLGEQNG